MDAPGGDVDIQAEIALSLARSKAIEEALAKLVGGSTLASLLDPSTSSASSAAQSVAPQAPEPLPAPQSLPAATPPAPEGTDASQEELERSKAIEEAVAKIQAKSKAVKKDGVSAAKPSHLDPSVDPSSAVKIQQQENVRAYKRVQCSFWQRGLCTKGEFCTFAHGDTDQQRAAKKAQTDSSKAPQGSTNGGFAHGPVQIDKKASADAPLSQAEIERKKAEEAAWKAAALQTTTPEAEQSWENFTGLGVPPPAPPSNLMQAPPAAPPLASGLSAAPQLPSFAQAPIAAMHAAPESAAQGANSTDASAMAALMAAVQAVPALASMEAVQKILAPSPPQSGFDNVQAGMHGGGGNWSQGSGGAINGTWSSNSGAPANASWAANSGGDANGSWNSTGGGGANGNWNSNTGGGSNSSWSSDAGNNWSSRGGSTGTTWVPKEKWAEEGWSTGWIDFNDPDQCAAHHQSNSRNNY